MTIYDYLDYTLKVLRKINADKTVVTFESAEFKMVIDMNKDGLIKFKYYGNDKSRNEAERAYHGDGPE